MKYVTSVERIGIRKGREQGLEEGIEQGIEQGMLKGKIALLKDQLLYRFSELPAWVEKTLSEASPKDLERWARNLLDARSLEDVFATT